jgi:hypothetical protein
MSLGDDETVSKFLSITSQKQTRINRICVWFCSCCFFNSNYASKKGTSSVSCILWLTWFPYYLLVQRCSLPKPDGPCVSALQDEIKVAKPADFNTPCMTILREVFLSCSSKSSPQFTRELCEKQCGKNRVYFFLNEQRSIYSYEHGLPVVPEWTIH